MDYRVSLADGIGLAGIILAVVIFVLDKAGKLKGGWLVGLLLLAGVMTIFLAVGNSWVLDAPAKWKLWRGVLMFSLVALTYSGMAIWITGTKELPVSISAHPNRAPEPTAGPITPPSVSASTAPGAPAPKVKTHHQAETKYAPAPELPVEKPAAPQKTELQTVEPEKPSDGQTLGNSPQIQAAINKVLNFPNAVQDSTEPPTITETLLKDQAPRKLFNVLMRYDESGVSPMLRDFLRKYYQFEQDTGQFENELLGKIGGSVTVRFRLAWAIYLRYAILRFAGLSKDQVIAGGNFLNYDISWEDAENVYGQLLSDPLIAKRFSITFSQYAGFVELTNKLRTSAQ